MHVTLLKIKKGWKTLVKSKIYKKTSAYLTQESPPDLNFWLVDSEINFCLKVAGK